MWRTRVGYSGGTAVGPTYRAIGDHSEAIQIDFDPAVVSYRDLLAHWASWHNPCARAWSRQYRSAIFFHSPAQRQAAADVIARHAANHGTVNSGLEAFSGFTMAEDYHQKHRLRGDRAMLREVVAIYPAGEDFANSTVAMRLNGWLGGSIDRGSFEREVTQCGLSDQTVAVLRAR